VATIPALARRPGMGQAEASDGRQVPVGWKYATFGLAGLVVAQFFWWDAKAPEVLRGAGYVRRNRRRRRAA